MKTFAKAIGVSENNLNFYIGGYRNIGAKWRLRLEPLGLNWDWLLTGKGEMMGRAERDGAEPKVFFYAPDGVSEEMRRRYLELAKELSKLPPEELPRFHVIIKAFLEGRQSKKQ